MGILTTCLHTFCCENDSGSHAASRTASVKMSSTHCLRRPQGDVYILIPRGDPSASHLQRMAHSHGSGRTDGSNERRLSCPPCTSEGAAVRNSADSLSRGWRATSTQRRCVRAQVSRNFIDVAALLKLNRSPCAARLHPLRAFGGGRRCVFPWRPSVSRVLWSGAQAAAVRMLRVPMQPFLRAGTTGIQSH